MSFQGLDPEEMERFQLRLSSCAARLRQVHVGLGQTLAQVPWHGDSADRFRHEWHGSFRTRFAAAAADIDSVAQQVKEQRLQQLRASAASTGRLFDQNHASIAAALMRRGHVFTTRRKTAFYASRADYASGRKVIPRYLENLYPELGWALGTGRSEALAHAHDSPDAQEAWWQQLSPAKQEALLVAYPLLLLQLPGLSRDIRQRATSAYRDEVADATVAKVQSQSSALEVDAPVIAITTGVNATSTVYASGRTEVTVSFDAGVARQVGSGPVGASIGVEGGVATTYDFATPAEATAFLEGLHHQFSLGGDPAGYLAGFSPLVTSNVVHVQGQGEVHIDLGHGTSASISGDAGISHDLVSKNSTAYVDLQAHAQVAGRAADISGHVELQYDGAVPPHLVGATVTATASVTSMHEAHELMKQVSGRGLATGDTFHADQSISHGSVVTFTATVDPHDPLVVAALKQMVEHPESMASLQTLVAHSDATMEVGTVTSADGSASAGAGPVGEDPTHSVKVTSHATTEIFKEAYVKEKNTQWVDVSPPAGTPLRSG